MWGVCNCSMFCCALLCVRSSIAIILMGKRELVAMLNLSSWCLMMVERLFLGVPWGCLRFVIVVFPDHTHLLFTTYNVRITHNTTTLESPYHLSAVSGAHFTQGTILIVILVSSGSAKSRTHQFAVGGFLVTRRGLTGRLRACRIWTFINSV